jgi:hypothetical protein
MIYGNNNCVITKNHTINNYLKSQKDAKNIQAAASSDHQKAKEYCTNQCNTQQQQ